MSTKAGYFRIRRGFTTSGFALDLSSDGARWAVLRLWDAAKEVAGVFDSEAQLRERMGRYYRYVPELRAKKWLDGLAVHDWSDDQVDPSQQREAGKRSAEARKKLHGSAQPVGRWTPSRLPAPDQNSERPFGANANDPSERPFGQNASERSERSPNRTSEPTETDTEYPVTPSPLLPPTARRWSGTAAQAAGNGIRNGRATPSAIGDTVRAIAAANPQFVPATPSASAATSARRKP